MNFPLTALGIDPGEKNVGIAVGTLLGPGSEPAVQALGVLRVQQFADLGNKSTSEFGELAEALRTWNPSLIVVGAGGSVQNIRKIAAKLQQKVIKFASATRDSTGIDTSEISKTSKTSKISKIELAFQDEIYSTRASNQGLTRKQKRTLGDAHAAADILSTYLRNLADS